MSIDLHFWYNVYRQTDSIRKEPMLMDIILYLLNLIQLLYKQNFLLFMFICKYIPLKQWAFNDSDSPKYQKFKIDKLDCVYFMTLFYSFIWVLLSYCFQHCVSICILQDSYILDMNAYVFCCRISPHNRKYPSLHLLW